MGSLRLCFTNALMEKPETHPGSSQVCLPSILWCLSLGNPGDALLAADCQTMGPAVLDVQSD